ncbi:MAG: hypothetical protein ACPIA1_07170 [Flavobacteriaceae bacterium]
MSQLEFYKTVLQKVNFDDHLFKKEYKKAMSELSLMDRMALYRWCKQKLRPQMG